MKIVVLSTDTCHHRYFINRIHSEFPLDVVFLETEGLDKKRLFLNSVFKAKGVRNKLRNIVFSSYWQLPLFEKREEAFEEGMFFQAVSKRFPSDIQIVSTANVNQDNIVQQLKEIAPAVIILFGVRKVSKNITQIPQKCILNIHRGIVPQYRGLDSNLWAIYFDDFSNIGVTVHLVQETLDTGRVVFQEKLKLAPQISIFHLRYHTTLMATEMVLRALRDIQQGQFSTYRQDGTGRYFSFMPYFLKFVAIYKFLRKRKQLQKTIL